MTLLPVPPDSLRAALDSVFRSSAYDWRPQDTAVSWLHARWLELMAWLTRLHDINPLVYRAFITLLVLVLLAVILHAAWLLIRTTRTAQSGASGLPAEGPARPHDAAWFQAEADRLAREGRFADAVQAAFVALARRLEGHGLLQYHPAKTPAECAREARLAESDRPRLRGLVRDLYGAAFGGAPFGAEEFARWQREALGEWHAAAH